MSKYRHELKLSINSFDRQILSSRLSCCLKKDQHTGKDGYYTVRSIYFDDDRDTAVKEKLMGIKYREKFRIRTYGQDTDFIKLEKKVKNDGLGYKESALLTKVECNRILTGDYYFLKKRKEKVCLELYLKMRTGLFKPKTIVEYKREAYVWNPGRIRITIDSDIKSGLGAVDFLNFNIPLVDVVGNDTSILEIKYDNFLPAHIGNLLQLESRRKGSFSKYVMCRRYS